MTSPIRESAIEKNVCETARDQGRLVGPMQETPMDNDENGWVIERGDSEPCAPMYWRPSRDGDSGYCEWHADHLKALRFARRLDAKIIHFMLFPDTDVRICEHIWAHPSKQECVGASVDDYPSFEAIHFMIEEAFNRGLEAALKAAAAASTDTSNDEPAAASAQTKICIFRDRMLSAIRSLKNTGETGDEKQDGELNDTNLAELQRLGQEFDAAPDLSETESVGSLPSQQGDDDAGAQIQALIGRWHRGDPVGSVECEAVLRKSATALKTLKAASNSYAAKCDSLTKKMERLEDLLRDATFPTHGDRGGPLCSVMAAYEDGSEASKGHEPNRDARAALAEEGA